MHLLSINNIDYGMMTLLFALILLIAYCFRRKNRSSGDFLLAQNHNLPLAATVLSLSGVGLIEFIVATSYGAFSGLNALYLALPIIIVITLLFDYRTKVADPLAVILNGSKSTFKMRVFLIFYMLVMLLVAGIAISVMVGMLYSLLGWQFGNSTLSLMGVILIFMLLGGVIGVFYNQALVNLIMFITLLVVAVVANHNFGGEIVNHLHTMALQNALPKDSFTSLNHISVTQLWLVVVATAALLILNPLWCSKREKLSSATKALSLARIIQWLILTVMILVGVFALATPSKQPLLHGQKVITQQTRLADGTLGFVVKAVPNDGITNQLGIIPKQMNDDSEVASTDSSNNPNDYISSAMVLVGNTIGLAFVSLYIIMSLFIKTISESIAFIAQALIRGFYAPYFNKSGDDLESLWAARVFIFALTIVVIAVGLVLYKFYDLYFALSLLLVMAFPLMLHFLGLSRSYWVDIINYLSLVGVCALVEINNVPSVLPLIHFASLTEFITYLSSGTLLFYGLSWLLLKALKY